MGFENPKYHFSHYFEIFSCLTTIGTHKYTMWLFSEIRENRSNSFITIKILRIFFFVIKFLCIKNFIWNRVSGSITTQRLRFNIFYLLMSRSNSLLERKISKMFPPIRYCYDLWNIRNSSNERPFQSYLLLLYLVYHLHSSCLKD